VIVGDWMFRLASPVGAAWRRQWLAGLPARLLVVAPVVVALVLAGSAATALQAGSWLTWLGVAAVVGFLLLGARPGPAVGAIATIPAAVTVLLLLATPLRTWLVVGESALLLSYLLLLERWESPGGGYRGRLVLLLPGVALASALVVAGLFVAGGAATGSTLIAVVGLAAALGATVLTVRSGRFR